MIGHRGSPVTHVENTVESFKAALDEGANDGDDWICLGRLKTGRWFFLSAGCDYTGWDCQAGGRAYVSETRDLLERMAMTAEDRRRLHLETEMPSVTKETE